LESKIEELLSEIADLISEGKYDEASKKVDNLKKFPELNSNLKTKFEIYRAILKNRLGQYEESLDLISTIQRNQNELLSINHSLIIDLFITQVDSLWRLEKNDEAIDVIIKTEREFPKNISSMNKKQLLQWASLLTLKGSVFSDKGDNDRAMDLYMEGMRIREKHGDAKSISISYNNIGTVYWYRGNYKEALDYFDKSMILMRELKDERGLAISLNNIGSIYRHMGELDKALECYYQSETLFAYLGMKTNFAISLLNTGTIYRQKGDLNRSIKRYQRSISVLRETGNKNGLSMALNNIGEIYRQKGELTKALDYYNESLVIFRELGNDQNIGMAISNIGETYGQKGDLKLAIENIQKALDIFRKIGNKLFMTYTLFALVNLFIEKHDIESAKRHYEELEKIDEMSDNKVINLRKRIAEALLLKTSSRTKNRGKAEIILSDIVKSKEIVDHEMLIFAMLNLCDLLLADLKISGESELLKEINELVFKLRDIADTQHSYSLLVETYLLQSRFFLLETDVINARKTLFKGQLIAEEKGLQLLAMKLSREHDLLLEEEKQWITSEEDLQRRMEFTKVGELVNDMIQKKFKDLDDIPEEKPEMLMLLSKSGISLFSSFFLSSREINDQLIGGFLSAINTFSSHIFERSIDRIKIGEYTVLFKSLNSLMTCYIFQGQSYSASRKLEQFINLLQNNYLFDKLQLGVRSGIKLNSTDHSSLKTLVDETFLSEISYQN